MSRKKVMKSFAVLLLGCCLNNLALATDLEETAGISAELINTITLDQSSLPLMVNLPVPGSPPTGCEALYIMDATYNADATRLVVGIGSGEMIADCDFSGAVQIFDMTGDIPELLNTLNYSSGWVMRVTYNHDGSQLAVGYGNAVSIYDGVNTGTPLVTLIDKPNNLVASINYSNNGNRLAIGRSDQVVSVYDATDPVFPLLKTLGGWQI